MRHGPHRHAPGRRALILCLLIGRGTTASIAAQTRDWRIGDRAVIGPFSNITSVAASSERVYATSPATLLVWNLQWRRWEGPFDGPPGALDNVFAALVDPLDQTYWGARPDGWVHFDPRLVFWEVGSATDRVIDIAFDLDQPAAGLFLRTTRGWQRASRGTTIATPSAAPRRPLRPPTVVDAIRDAPALAANASAILLDPRMRPARFTAAARAFGDLGWFLGTSGVGLLHLPLGAAIPERMPFGLPGEIAGAVFAAPGGVWVATDESPVADAAVTFVASDLSAFRVLQGPRATGLPFHRVYRLAGRDRDLWAATDVGVARIPTDGGAVETFDEGRGVPDRRVLSIAARGNRVLIGTAHGVAALDTAGFSRLAPDYHDQALAVQSSGDTVWVGTPFGIFALLPGDNDLGQPAGLSGDRAFEVPVVALSWLGDTLVGLTQDRLLWRSPGSGAWTLGPLLSGTLGKLRALVPFENGFYVGGERGFGYVRLSSPPIRPLFAPGDLPGEVYDLAIDGEYLWTATAHGLVRWRLEAVRP